MLHVFPLLLLFIPLHLIDCQLHDLEVTTQPSWAPTGRLNQFNGFATPRPSLLPQNAQMVYASVWAAWSAWSFCADSKRIRVRACNTVRGFRCLGPNQETEPCDPATSPILGRPPRPNNILTDYDTVDPWQEDRLEALKQLYPDESIDEKLSHLPEHEKERMRARLELAPPSPLSHELLNRPENSRDGAPGSTPERLFGARALGAKAFAVNSNNGQQAIKLPELLTDDQIFSDITHDKQLVDEVEKAENEFASQKGKNRGEGTFSKKEKMTKIATTTSSSVQEVEEVESEMNNLMMDGPKFSDKKFTEDIFGSIEDLMGPSPATEQTEAPTTTKVSTTTTPATTTTTTTETTTTVRTTPSTTTTTTTTAKPTSTPRRPPTRVTPRLPTVAPEDTVELVTPSMKVMKNPEVINFFEEELGQEEATTRKPWKTAIHYGEVVPSTTTTTTTTTTQAPTTSTTIAGFPIPEEISLDTLHALDWMLANMTKAAEESQLENNELRRRLDSSPNDQSPIPSTKVFAKKRLPKKHRPKTKTHRTKVIQLHYGEVTPAELANRKFPKFRSRNAHRAKIFGIKTSNIPEQELLQRGKKEELVEEINDLKDLMEQLDEKIESRSALMEETFDSLLSTKHEHDSPYRRHV